MATPLSAATALKKLRAEGLTVVEYRSWKTHNRGQRGDGWGPVHGVLLHHTVTRGDTTAQINNSVKLCYDGYSSLPGPLCHGVIDPKGVVHMVGWGRANHAGLGDDDVLRAVIAEKKLPAPNEMNTDGNARLYGFECINMGDGKDDWPPEQVEAMVRASAALLRAHGWGKDGDTSVLGHLEWTNTKIDPRGPGFPGMNAIRKRVAERLKHPASWSPEGDSPGESEGTWHTVAKGDTLYSLARQYGTTVKKIQALNPELDDPNVIVVGQRIRVG